MIEVTDSAGQRTAVEPAYDQLEAERDFGIIRETACRQRQCADYGDFDPSLTVNDVQLLRQKNRTDRLAQAIETNRRIQKNADLHSALQLIQWDSALTPQQRGKKFEEWCGHFFTVSRLIHTLHVKNDREQLDFTVWLGNLFCIGEAHWLKEPVDAKQVRDFFGKMMDRP